MKRLFILSLTTLLMATPAFAGKDPRPGSADQRIQRVAYNEHDVVKILGHYGYSTMIRFASDEVVQNISLGDSIAWQAVPNKQGNLLFVKPVEENAVTNLSVVTDRRVYSFELGAGHETDPDHGDIVFQVVFHYPQDELELLLARERDAAVSRNAVVNPGEPGSSPASWNFEYTFGGDRNQVPKRIFDDGKFTYFEFDNITDTPAIFLVAADRSESLINYTVQGRYIVVHRTARQFTLRNGKDVTCIFNETYSGESDLDLNSPKERGASDDAPLVGEPTS